MKLLWTLLFPFLLSFFAFAEGEGGNGDDNGEDSEDGEKEENGEDFEDGEGEEESDDSEDLDSKKLKEELIATRLALRKANSEAKERRLKLKKFEEEEAKRKKADMGDLEKAQTELKEVTVERDKLQVARVDREINYAVKLEALKQGFTDPADAFHLIDLSKIEVDKETFKVLGVSEALKALAKAKPYLIKSEEDGDGHGTPRKKGKKKGKGKETLSDRSMVAL